MRVVVLTTSEHDVPAVRLLTATAAGLAARGEVTALVCLSRGAVERVVEQDFPRLSHRAVVGTGFVRRAASVRGIVTALRPDAVLVGSDEDASLAMVAMGARGGVLRRLSASESAAVRREGDDAVARRPRLARAGTRYEAWGTDRVALGWPEPPALSAPDGAIHPLPISPPHLAIVPGRVHDEHTATALRTAALLRSRHPTLRITLFGEVAALQATRLHAAALDLTSALQLAPLHQLLGHEPLPALAVWVCAAGDTGAIAALAAMQQQLPVISPSDSAHALLVDVGVTGWLAEGATGADATPAPAIASLAAELARLLGDHVAARRMGEAARARAHAAFGWDAFLDDATERLARVGGTTPTRVRVRAGA